eukprot:gene6963-7614_t
MAAEEKELEKLIQWVRTFDQIDRNATVETLSHGVIICDIVYELIPTYFTEEMHNAVRRFPKNECAKIANVQKATEALVSYLGLKFKVKTRDVPSPIEEKVVACDPAQLMILLRLLLTCAVNSRNKEAYVQRILADSDLAQHLMASIKSVQDPLQAAAKIQREDEQASDSEDDDLSTSRLQHDLDGTTHRLRHLQIEHDAVVEENRELERELEEMKKTIATFESQGTGSHEEDRQRIHDLTVTVAETEDALRSEQMDHETTKKECQRALNEMKRQLEKTMAELNDMQELRDELAELRNRADQVPALESRLSTLQGKLAEAAELKQQRIVELESKENRLIEIQEELSESNTKHHTLEEQILELQKTNDRLQHEVEVQKKTCARFKEDKDRILREKGELEQQLEFARTGDLTTSVFSEGVDLERLIRLEHENESLRAQVGGTADQKSEKLQTLLEAAQKSKQELQLKNRELSLKVVKLESELNALQDSESERSSHNILIEQLAVCERSLKTAQDELSSRTNACERLKIQLQKSQTECVEAQKKLSLVGLDEKEMTERIHKTVMANFNEKISKLEETEDTLSKLEQNYKALKEERDSLASENTEQMKRITQILTQKDELNNKILQLQEATAGGSTAQSNEINRLRDALNQARKDYTALENQKLEEFSDGGNNFSEEGSAIIRHLQDKIKDLEKQIASKTQEIQKVHARYEREQQLMTTAWISLSAEHQKLCVRERERSNAGARGQSFLELQRSKAMNRKTVPNF